MHVNYLEDGLRVVSTDMSAAHVNVQAFLEKIFKVCVCCPKFS